MNLNKGSKIIYDNEECMIIDIFPQQNNSPSGDVLLEDSLGIQFLVNHNELEMEV